MKRKSVNSLNRVVIAIGSNIAPWRHVTKCLNILQCEHRIIFLSRFVRTRPLGFTEQPDFINGAILMETALSQSATQKYLKQLEKRLGRVRTDNKYGPRVIDLDIVLWNGVVVNDDFYTRDFLQRSVVELINQAG